MHHSTSWWVSGLFSSRSVGSSATSRPRPCDSLSSSAFDLATMATGSSGSGITHGSISSGSSLAERVSPVSARVSLATAQMSPAMRLRDGPLGLAERRRRARRPSRRRRGPRARGSSPKKSEKWPDTCTVVSGVSDPEKTRTSDDPADVGVGGGLDDLGDQRAGRVAGQRAARRAVGRGHRRDRVLQRRRERLRDDLEQLVRAEPGRRRGREDRVERAARDRGLEVVDQHLEVDVLAAEVAVHQRLVLGLRDDPLDQRVAGGVDERQVLGVRARARRARRRE